MKKMLLAIVLALQTFAMAEQCYFQTRRTSYDSGTRVKKISCETLKKAQQDVYFYNGNDNYARYYERQFGQEGNLIVEIDGYVMMTKFYYALGEFRYYGQIIYSGGNVVSCKTTTSTGYCDQVEYTDFGNYLRDFFNSSARKKSRKYLSTTGSFKDSRDGKIYKTVKIGGQTWMAQNLNYAMRESACYDLSDANCRVYGRLYTWNAAQFACPNGWHLPDTTEWIKLFNFAGGHMVAGKKLKSKRYWHKNFDGSRNNGDDSYGFSALPGGQVTNSGTFFGLGFINGFWTSSRYLLEVNYQSLGTQYYDYVCVATFTGDIASKCSYCREWEHYFSVRCIKD